MSTTFINTRNGRDVETIDMVCREDYSSSREYRRAVSQMLAGYRESGQSVYASQRCTKEWRESM